MATGNAGKLKEIQDLLCHLPVTLLSLSNFPNMEAVEETGTTFNENARLKAIGYGMQAGVLTLADDSGLIIDALDGRPGVHSARFLGEHATYAERIEALLWNLMDVSERTARFVCALAIASPDGQVTFATQATCEGRIADSPRGTAGFGYDPVFIPEGFDRTFGELPAQVKKRN